MPQKSDGWAGSDSSVELVTVTITKHEVGKAEKCRIFLSLENLSFISACCFCLKTQLQRTHIQSLDKALKHVLQFYYYLHSQLWSVKSGLVGLLYLYELEVWLEPVQDTWFKMEHKSELSQLWLWYLYGWIVNKSESGSRFFYCH